MIFGKKIIILIVGLILVGGVFYFIFAKDKRKVEFVSNEETLSENISLEENTKSELEDTSQIVKEKDVVNDVKSNVVENVTEEKKEEIAVENSKEEKETKTDAGQIIKNYISWGFQKASSRKIDTIIIHSSYDALGNDPYSVKGILKEYEMYGVAAHYLIDRKGIIYQLVRNSDIAYHAGVSKVPDGRENVNNFSIGIELVNTKNDNYTKDQYNALNQLISEIKKDYKIKYVLGHSQIAPGRKTDPWNFDYNKLK